MANRNQDIAERKQDHEARRRSQALLQTRLHLSEMAQQGSMQDVMQAALDEAETHTGSKIGFFHFVNEDQENLTLQAWSTNTLKNMCKAEGKGLHYPISKAGVWVDCFHARKPVIHNDYASLPNKKGLPEGHAPIVREMAVPIIRDGAVVAIMGVGNKPTDYTQQDVDALLALASPIMDLVRRKQTEEALRESEEKYHSLFESMLDGCAYCRMLYENEVPKDFIYIDVNDAFERLTGLKGVTGRKVSEVIPGLQQSNPELFQIYGRVASTGNPERFETYVEPLDIWFSISVYSPRKEHFVAVFDNITGRKRAEEALRHATEELKRSNKDLEQFAYIASHDLQEPLRMVSGFLKLLQESYGPQLDAKAHEYIGHSVDGATRMSQLIKDLLEYSRAGRTTALVPTKAGKALAAALANLGTSIQQAGATVTQDELPTVLGDPTQLMQLFQNLIGNAMKFRHPERPCRIHVAAVQRDGKWTFCVRDNGIGIDPRHAERVFLIFQRLHTREKYEGTGIGLAICKKIVERHGGQIWVESRPGEGATFCFTIPSGENQVT